MSDKIISGKPIPKIGKFSLPDIRLILGLAMVAVVVGVVIFLIVAAVSHAESKITINVPVTGSIDITLIYGAFIALIGGLFGYIAPKAVKRD